VDEVVAWAKKNISLSLVIYVEGVETSTWRGAKLTATCGWGGQGSHIAEPSRGEWEDRYQVDRGTILQCIVGDTTPALLSDQGL
jgi:hypothetical protein